MDMHALHFRYEGLGPGRGKQKSYLTAVDGTKYLPLGGSKNFGVSARPVNTDLTFGDFPSVANNALPS